jgi:hypothetical protein
MALPSIAHAILATQIRSGHTRLVILQYRNDKIFTDTLLLQPLGPSLKARTNFNQD